MDNRSSNGVTDLARVGTQIALSAGQPIASYLSEWSGRGQSVVERARQSDGPVAPAEGAFAIWGPLFGASTALAIWSATPERRHDPALRRIGWLACAATASNIAWSLNAQLSGLGWRSLGLIGASAASSIAALIEAERRFPRSPLARRATWAVGPLAGWLTLASFANLEATLNETRGRPTARTETQRAAALVGAASAAASGMAIATRGNLPFAGAVAWGLGGVVVRNVRERRRSVTAAACAGLIALAGVTLWSRRRR
ncbi:MAG TPA: hypothetical protein VJR89_33400 [Polyangiales bacterium]|nr:hypothetical protein [Polyangiales bacterium]